ncbi:MAG TPA: penicillin-binding transpeptidase domain-containing protein [Pirellulales bacterium]
MAPSTQPSHTDSRTLRLRWLLAGIAALSLLVLARVAALELWYGEEYREIAARPIERKTLVAASRGRILASDGTVLAQDREAAALAIHYRYLEQPLNRGWLRGQARRRLPKKQRRDAARLDAECRQVEADVARMHERLAKLCGLSARQYAGRLRAVQRRVERIAESVRARRESDQREPPLAANEHPWWRQLLTALEADVGPSSEDAVRVAEEYEYHPVFVGLALPAVAEIEGFSQRFPGAKITTWRQREYPRGELAAHVVGYVPDAGGEALLAAGARAAGMQGAERGFDAALRGTPGSAVEATDRTGQILARRVELAAEPGRDLRLTIDPPLQRAAEQLLDQAWKRRRARTSEMAPAGGGAIVVIDVQTGALACSASAPRFAPETAARGRADDLKRLFGDPAKPLFDRATRMALPPGSVFKPLTAIALIEEGVAEPARPFFCQGYLTTPEKERCQIFRQLQTGHGAIKLADALARSCNVYFYHHAGELGGQRLLAWARRCGFGETTGIDLPDEAAGGFGDRSAAATPAEVRALCIGQGALTVTPLQMARLMAIIANGGRLITPHVARSVAKAAPEIELSDRTLAVVRRGLELVVNSREGTGYQTARLADLEMAGKTGTAENGSGHDHAWFAGYAPAQRPRYAFALVIEYGGGGAETAAPLARRLVEKMRVLGYFDQRSRLATRREQPEA